MGGVEIVYKNNKKNNFKTSNSTVYKVIQNWRHSFEGVTWKVREYFFLFWKFVSKIMFLLFFPYSQITPKELCQF